MKRCLVLLTTGYPYTGIEPYLDAELPVLSARFNRILLLPIGISPDAKPQPFPDSDTITLCNTAVLPPRKAKLLDTLHGLPTVLRLPKIPKADIREAGASPARRAFLGYFLARSNRHVREIQSALSGMDFSGFDEVVLYSYWLFAAAYVASALRSFFSEKGIQTVRFISRAHSYDVYTYANRLHYLPCRSLLLDSADGVYTCSINGQKYLSERYPDFKEKIHVSYLGTHGGTLTNGSSDGTFRILTCAHAIPLKRLDRLCAVLARPELRNKSIHWTHIGDGTELPALREQVERLGISDKTDFPGTLPHEDVLQFYKNHSVDLFVSVSSREGLPVSVMEAFSFGVPALCTDVGGCSEMIRDKENGYLLCKDFTDDELCNALLFAIDHCASLRSNAFSTWETHFKAENNFRQFADILCGEEHI